MLVLNMRDEALQAGIRINIKKLTEILGVPITCCTATTGDGVLTAIKVLEICIEKKCSLSSLVSDVTIFPQILINVRVEKMDEVLERPELKEVTDGILEKLGDTGRIVLRKSGTEPLVRIMVEAQTDEECEKYANEIKDKILELSESMQ